MERPIIIALDFSTKKETEAFLQHFSGESLFVKVGMELFFQEGPSLLKELKERGHRIFLDVKLHDIPNTVYRTMRGLARFDIDLITVHAAGGTAMMKAALKGLAEGKAWGRKRTRCVAVTQLTSMTEEEIRKEQRIPLSLTESVVHYAKLARDAGLDGVISSVHEAPHIRKACGETFHIITPGIRLPDDACDDQKRIADPRTARKNGANAIVVGRSITRDENPYQRYESIKKLWEADSYGT